MEKTHDFVHRGRRANPSLSYVRNGPAVGSRCKQEPDNTRRRYYAPFFAEPSERRYGQLVSMKAWPGSLLKSSSLAGATSS